MLASTAPVASNRRRELLAGAVTVLLLAFAVVAGLTAPTTGGTPVLFVDRLSSAIGNVAFRAGQAWWAYAFALGAVAAFNPCGFGLLPAYLGLYLQDGATVQSTGVRLSRAIAVAVTVGVSFTVLFGAVGAVFEAASTPIVRSLPWIGLGVGVLLVLAGGLALSGRRLSSTLPQRAAARIGRRASSGGLPGYAAFGFAYAAASLGCSLPLFLALVGTATATSLRVSALGAFVLYGAGMASVLAALTIVAATLSFGVLGRVRSFGAIVSSLGAVLLLLSGTYVVFYWLTAGRLLLG